jgi:hypothetical protein
MRLAILSTTPPRPTARRSRSSALRRPILNQASPGQAAYDPFVGSRTTLIADSIRAASNLIHSKSWSILITFSL